MYRIRRRYGRLFPDTPLRNLAPKATSFGVWRFSFFCVCVFFLTSFLFRLLYTHLSRRLRLRFFAFVYAFLLLAFLKLEICMLHIHGSHLKHLCILTLNICRSITFHSRNNFSHHITPVTLLQ